jgi:hypothetical protein
MQSKSNTRQTGICFSTQFKSTSKSTLIDHPPRNLDIVDIDNVAGLRDGDMFLLDRGFHGVLCREDLIQFLELWDESIALAKHGWLGGTCTGICAYMKQTYCAVLGLRDKPPDDRCLDGVLDREDDVRLPRDVLQSHRPGELVEQPTDIDGQGGEGHALGAHLEGEHLDGEQSLKWCDADGVDAIRGS